jgi:POT family proton-dependent oligopeptide transporter
LINRNNFKLTSLGPDKTFMTKDDVIHKVSISRPATNTEATDKPLNWRESRMIELLGAKGQAQVDKERGGVPVMTFDTTVSVGGETKLEGAAYFWFWTWTMLFTSILFVFVALWYKPKTYLQEDAAAQA